MLKIILAKCELNSIGYKGDMPWGREFPEDLRNFAKTTMGCPVVMGRDTFLSLRSRMGLVGRENIVITSKPIDVAENVSVMTMGAFKAYAEEHKDIVIWAMGGKRIYEELLFEADELHITNIPNTYIADVFLNFNQIEFNKFEKVEVKTIPVKTTLAESITVDIFKRK